MDKKERFLGLRLTGTLAEALDNYCKAEDRSLSSAVRYLLTKELEKLGYMTEENRGKTRR